MCFVGICCGISCRSVLGTFLPAIDEEKCVGFQGYIPPSPTLTFPLFTLTSPSDDLYILTCSLVLYVYRYICLRCLLQRWLKILRDLGSEVGSVEKESGRFRYRNPPTLAAGGREPPPFLPACPFFTFTLQRAHSILSDQPIEDSSVRQTAHLTCFTLLGFHPWNSGSDRL